MMFTILITVKIEIESRLCCNGIAAFHCVYLFLYQSVGKKRQKRNKRRNETKIPLILSIVESNPFDPFIYILSRTIPLIPLILSIVESYPFNPFIYILSRTIPLIPLILSIV